MSTMFIGLTETQKMHILFLELVILAICTLLHCIKIKYQYKIDKCNNKIVKKIFEQL